MFAAHALCRQMIPDREREREGGGGGGGGGENFIRLKKSSK